MTLSDLLVNELAKDTKFNDFQFEANIGFKADDMPGVLETPAAYKLFLDLKKDEQDGEFVLYLWSKEWRDDFDSNNTKASRNQVWRNTTTTCPPKDETKGRNTYFLSLSCKGDDHSGIEDIFQKELDILSTKGGVFYHGGLKHLIQVKLGKLLVCVDCPERTSLLQVGDHNGTYSSFWAHSCFVDGFCKENHLPSCEECHKKHIEQIFGINHKQKVVRAHGADDVLPSCLGEINLTRDYFDTVDKILSQINLTSNYCQTIERGHTMQWYEVQLMGCVTSIFYVYSSACLSNYL